MNKRVDDNESVVTAAAKAALAKSKDYHEATDRMERAARRNPDLMAALMEPYVRQACYNAVRKMSRSERSIAWNAPPADPQADAERVLDYGDSILDRFRLPSGMPLRDATAVELEEAAGFYKNQADDMAWKSRWMMRLAQRVGRRKVGNALTEAQVRAIQEETKK